MAGKQKQAHRTKGNVKPSSSARAAELLQGDSGTSLGFIGFGALSGDLGYVPATHGSEIDTDVDADFRMVLRKVSKRDTTTKLKALQEFASLCKEKNVEEVKTVLPFWPRIYSKVSVDNDRRVREGCQLAFLQLVLRVRRNLAPYLKSLMGSWLMAQSDVYAPAASAAKTAFESAFPPAKQTEAIVFCKTEVLDHIQDNLFNQTPQTLSDPKTTEPEDMEAKYQKVLSSTLGSLSLFLITVPPLQQESLIDTYRNILKDARFWKLAKKSTSTIRGSFYSVLSAFCQAQPALAEEFASKFCPTILHFLDESDPVVSPALWEATLHLITSVQDCWSKINTRKGMLPKLWSFLRNAGHGNAVMLYPNLLPFISQLPEDITGQGLDFYQEFFENLKAGLSTDQVLSSPSECSAVVKALMECLHYWVSQYLDETHGPDSNNIVDFCLQDQLMPLLEASLLDPSTALSTTKLYDMVVELIIFLFKQKNVESKAILAAKFYEMFITNILDLSSRLIQLTDNSNKYILQRLACFLECFQQPSLYRNIKPSKAKVAFALEETDAEIPHRKVSLEVARVTEDSNIVTRWIFPDDEALLKIVCQVCKMSLSKSQDLTSVPHLKFFTAVFRTFACEKVLQLLVQGVVDEAGSEAMQFWREILLPWLQTCCVTVNTKDRGSVIECLSELTLSVFSLASAEEKGCILSCLIQDIKGVRIHYAVLRKLQKAPSDDKIRRWLKGSEFGVTVISVTRSLCRVMMTEQSDDCTDTDETQASWDLLSFALSSDDTMEPVIGDKYTEEIIREIQQALPVPGQLTDKNNERLQRCIDFVCNVATNFFSNVKSCLLLTSTEELLLVLFKLGFQDSLDLPDQLVEKVTTTWVLGVKALIQQKGGLLNDGGFFVQAATYIKSVILTRVNTVTKLRASCHVTMTLCRAMVEQLCLKEEPKSGFLHPTMQEFMKILQIPFVSSILPQWIDGPLIMGDLIFGNLPHLEAGSSALIPRCMAPVAFFSQLLVSMQSTTVATDDAMEDEQESSETRPEYKAVGFYLQDSIVNLAHAISFGRALLGGKRQTLHDTELNKVTTLLEETFSNLLQDNDLATIQTVLEHSLSKSLKEGGLWSLSLDVILREAEHLRLKIDAMKMIDSAEMLSSSSEPGLHTLQCLLPHFSKMDVANVAQIQAALLLSCSHHQICDIPGGLSFLSTLTRALKLQDATVNSETTDPGSLHTDIVLNVLAAIQSWRQDFSELFAFDCTVKELEWSKVMLNVELMRYLEVVVSKCPTILSDKLWDLVLCSLVSWLQTCSQSEAGFSCDIATQVFTVETCRLMKTVEDCITKVVPEQRDRFPSTISTEWEEFFVEGLYSLLLPMFVTAAGSLDDREPSVGEDLVMKYLGEAIALCPVQYLQNHQLPPKLVAGQVSNLPDEITTLHNHLCPLLRNSNRSIQLTAFRLIQHIMPHLSKFDEGKTKDEDKDEISRSPPAAVMGELEASSHAVAILLQDIELGEMVVLDPYTTEYTIAFEYLLSWRLILDFFRAASSELRVEYALHLKETNAVHNLLLNLFRLMPENPLFHLKDSLTSQANLPKLTSTKNMFSEEPLLDIAGSASSQELQHLACSVYYQALQDLPAILRQWLNSQDKKTAGIVEKFTSKFVSPILRAREINTVYNRGQIDMSNMTVKARPTTSEVLATYCVEEVSMELLITLPPSYPLGQINVDCRKRIGVANNQWRHWMLQLTTFLSHQNGSILDGLSLWKRNVDKKFEGVEECMICFSVIHGATFQLPKLQCKTCKKKYHSACLYKWFNTSNNATCPLCRNLF